MSQDLTLVELLINQSKKYSHKPFMIQGETDRTLSYADFSDRCFKLAGLLEELAIDSGARVALLLQNSLEYACALGGTFLQGAVAGPINSLFKAQELEYVLNHQEARLLFSEAEFFPLIQQIRHQLPNLEYILELSSQHPNGVIVHRLKNSEPLKPFYGSPNGTIQDLPKDVLKNGPRILTWEMMKKKAVAAKVQPHDPALILYTSGTTGQPKGALLSHEAFLEELCLISDQTKPTSEDWVLNALPLFHIFALMFGFLGPIYSGATTVILKSFHPEHYIQSLMKYPITITEIVPTIAFILLQIAEKAPQVPQFPKLRQVICGASALSIDVHKKLEETFNVHVYEGYGLTEACMAGCLNTTEGKNRKWGSVGKPWPGHNEIAIFNDQSKTLSVGQIGEIVIRGKNLMLGYLKDPKATSETLRGGWLHTGDLGYLDQDGYLYIIGRKKEMIIVGGENVYPREVEEALAMLPEIAEVAVIGFPHEKYGEEVVACVALKNPGVDGQRIVDFAKEKLAPFKVPRKVLFFEKLPRNASGKVLKNDLKAQLAENIASVME